MTLAILLNRMKQVLFLLCCPDILHNISYSPFLLSKYKIKGRCHSYGAPPGSWGLTTVRAEKTQSAEHQILDILYLHVKFDQELKKIKKNPKTSLPQN